MEKLKQRHDSKHVGCPVFEALFTMFLHFCGRPRRQATVIVVVCFREEAPGRNHRKGKNVRNRDHFFLFLLVVGFAIGAGSVCAGTAGNLDSTFGSNGVATVNVANTDGIVNSMLLQSDGKIVVNTGGNTLVRFTSTGALDSTFGNQGVVVLSTPIAGSLVQQTDGQLVIGGVVTPSGGGAELGVVRLNTNGSLDATFGNGGASVVGLQNRAPNVGSASLLQPNGDIVVCTTLISIGRHQPYQTALARFNPNGTLDTQFGTQGLSIQTGVNGCTAMALLSDGDYLVVNGVSVAEFTASGTAKASVTGGTVVASSQSSAAFEPSIFDVNGNYLFGTELFVGEESRGHDSSAEVLGFTQTGTQVIDTTFHYQGTGGSGIEAIADGIAVGASGDIAVVGGQTTFAQSGTTTSSGVARLTPSGALDSTFGNGGIVANNIPAGLAVAVQSDGDIVAAGYASNNTTLTLARYLGH